LYHRTKICTIPFLFSGQPSPEETALEQRDNEKENIRKQNKNKRGKQDPRVFFSEYSTFPYSRPHARKIKQNAQIEEQQEQGGFLNSLLGGLANGSDGN
jgi:hypothetical protein